MSARDDPGARALGDTGDEVRGALALVAIAVAVALLAVSFAGYDQRLFAPHIVARQTILLPLALALATVCVVWCRPGLRPVNVDAIDVTALAFAAWVILSGILSPAPWVAWLGYYNRGTGCLFVLVELLLLVAARRVLASGQAVRALIWAVSALLALLAGVALLQAAGGGSYWTVADPWPGRWTGTTGNPLTIAGLSLLGLWLGGWLVADRLRRPDAPAKRNAARSARRRRRRAPAGRDAPAVRTWQATRWVALVGVLAALIANLLAVTRASYAGWAVGLALLAVWLWRRRSRRELVVVLAVLAVIVVSAFVPVPDGRGGSRTLLGRVENTRGESGGLGENDSRRLELWGTAARAVARRPLLGYGAGAYIVADRLLTPPESRVADPGRFSSDPHSLPLLVGASTGIIGLALFAGLVVLVARLLLRYAAGLKSAGGPRAVNASRDGPGKARDADRGDGAVRVTWAVAGLAYLSALGVYFLFGPLDIAVAVPMALAAGMTVPICVRSAVRVWTVPRVSSEAAGRAIAISLASVVALACAAAIVLGVRFYRADLAMAAFAASDSPAEARRAQQLFPWEPFYALEAGAATWRTAAGADEASRDTQGMRQGDALVRAGIRRDPTGPTGYADLARFDIATGRFAAIPGDVRPGLLANPHQPVLEGLWAYAAVDALSQSNQAAATALHESLIAADPRSPDAWYWISVYLGATGDKAVAAEALQRAHTLAPHLTADDYKQRLLRSR